MTTPTKQRKPTLMPLPKFSILLLSGGLDSVTLLYDLKQQKVHVHAVLFDYHQRHVQELQFAKAHCARMDTLYTTVQLPHLGTPNEDSWVVPNRNAVMLSVGVNIAVKAGADSVIIGCNKDDAEMFPDCRPEFIAAMNAAVKSAGYNIEICAPYLGLRKWQIGGIAQEMGVPMHEIWSCYMGGLKPCGKCPACINAAKARQ